VAGSDNADWRYFFRHGLAIAFILNETIIFHLSRTQSHGKTTDGIDRRF
jgi:hypothetical protein